MTHAADIGRYERLEFGFDRPVDHLLITAPSGETDTVLPFWFRPIDVTYDADGFEHVTVTGADECRARYTPRECGRYTVTAAFTDGTAQTSAFTACERGHHGYIGVSRADHRYFAHTDGTPFVPIGLNTARPIGYRASNGQEFGHSDRIIYAGVAEYDRWFRQCAANGVNLIRLWVGYNYFNPDPYEGDGWRLERLSLLDRVIDTAARYGIAVKLTVDQFRFFEYTGNNYSGNAFAKSMWQGERRCESMEEFLHDPVWKARWLTKVGMLARRYAGCTNLFAIELWNEMNAVFADFDRDIVPWNREMAPQVQKLFPHNMVINSLGSLEYDDNAREYRDFPWDLFAFRQVHRYLNLGAQFKACHHDMLTVVTDAVERMGEGDTPLLLAETGAVEQCHSGPFKFYKSDHRGLLFADCVYTPLFLGTAGCGNIWHWDNYVEAKNLYHLYAPLAALIRGIAFDREDFCPLQAIADGLRVFLLRGTHHTLGYMRNAEDNWENVLRDDREPVPVTAHLPIDLPKGKLTLFPIWADDTAAAERTPEGLAFRAVRHGLLFRTDY